MKRLLFFLIFLIPWVHVSAQPLQQIQYVTTNPTGNVCFSQTIQELIPNGNIYTCQNGTMALVGGGGGGTWTLSGSDIFNSNSGNVGVGGAPGAFKLDISKSGASGAMRIYDQTPTTGVSTLFMQAGAAQNPATCSNDFLRFLNQAGASPLAGLDCQGNYYTYNASVLKKATLASTGVGFSSDSMLQWKNVNNLDTAGTYDICMGRNSAGVAEINNCTLGIFRDLNLRNITLSGTCTGCATTYAAPFFPFGFGSYGTWQVPAQGSDIPGFAVFTAPAGTFTINKAVMNVSTASGIACTGGTCGLIVGIYNSTCTTKLASSNVLVSGGSPNINATGVVTATFGTPLALTPGTSYCLSVMSDSTVIRLVGVDGSLNYQLSANANGSRVGFTTTAGTGNGASIVLPASLAPLSPRTDAYGTLPYVMFE